MSDQLTAAELKNLATAPASASVDGRAASAHNLRDVLEVEKYNARKAASNSRRLGIRFLKINPPAPR